MLERIQVNSTTHPYSSRTLLTPPSTHQTNSGFKHSQPHLAAGCTTAAHQLWKVLERPGNGPLRGDSLQRNSCGSHLPHHWLTHTNLPRQAVVQPRKVMASLASGHKADPLCPGLGLPAQCSPTQVSPPLKKWLSKAQVRLRSPEPVRFQTCLVYFFILVLSL